MASGKTLQLFVNNLPYFDVTSRTPSSIEYGKEKGKLPSISHMQTIALLVQKVWPHGHLQTTPALSTQPTLNDPNPLSLPKDKVKRERTVEIQVIENRPSDCATTNDVMWAHRLMWELQSTAIFAQVANFVDFFFFFEKRQHVSGSDWLHDDTGQLLLYFSFSFS